MDEGDKTIPVEVRKACLILHLNVQELSKAKVLDAWKKEIIEVHPKKGGTYQSAIILNKAQETLLSWLAKSAGRTKPPSVGV